jgi:uncharacterized membrane protein YhhN
MSILADILILLGAALVTAGAFLVSVPLSLFVGGLFCFLFSFLLIKADGN